MKDNKSFPVIIIPHDYSGSNFLDFTLIVPPIPKYITPEKKEFGEWIMLVLFIFLVALIYALKGSLIFLIIWGIAFFLMVSHYLAQHRNVNQQYKFLKSEADREYEASVKKRKRIMEYKMRFDEIINNEQIQTSEKRRLFLSLKLEYLKTTFITSDYNREGYSESNFYKVLISSFGEEYIKRGLSLNGYTPDFLYLDAKNAINLVIEIDEPYILKTREPIHYLGADDNKNLNYLEGNCAVVRFTEYHIVKETQMCINTITSVINFLLGKNDTFKNFNTRIRMWDYDEAINYSQKNIRERYLGLENYNSKRYENDIYLDDDDNLPF